MTPRRGRLISLEGITGSGKSTVASRAHRACPALVRVGGYGSRLKSPDPFHQGMLRLIRRRVSDDPFIRVDWRVECLLLQAELVLASRVIVEPALASGKVVLYEHHADSIIAYQAARLVEDSVLAGIGKAVAATRALLSGFNVNRPDCVIYLQSNPAMASRRAEQRDNRLPTPKSAAFNRLVAQAYGSLYARATSDRVIRAAGPDDAIEHLRNLLAKAR